MIGIFVEQLYLTELFYIPRNWHMLSFLLIFWYLQIPSIFGNCGTFFSFLTLALSSILILIIVLIFLILSFFVIFLLRFVLSSFPNDCEVCPAFYVFPFT